MVKEMKLMRTVIWHDQRSETVRQRLTDVDEARGMIQEVCENLNVRWLICYDVKMILMCTN